MQLSTCGMLFIIPAPPPQAEEPVVEQFEAPVPQQEAAPNPFEQVTAEPELLHIPCPNGHELETPADMIGQEVLCPHCNAQFKLRAKNSVEYKRRQAQEHEREDRRLGTAWINWAIVIAVLVVLGLVFLILSSTTE